MGGPISINSRGAAVSGPAKPCRAVKSPESPVLNPTSSGVQEDWDQKAWAQGYCNVDEELDDVLLRPVRGSVPPELRGTLYRNIVGRSERGGIRFQHPFDGDGMIVSVRFTNDGVIMRNRFVRTEGWQAEEKAGEILYRGVFGTQKPGGPLANAFDLRMKNIANTHVVQLGDQLLALWEAAGPHALDPVTLETRGLSSLDGVLKPKEPFSAHPRFDPGHHGTPRMVTFGVTAGPFSKIRLFEFATEGPEAGRLMNNREDTFPGFAFLHDFAITPNWAIFLQNAVDFNPLPFVFGLKGAGECLKSKVGGNAKWWLIPRDSGAFAGQAPRILDGPTGFVFHHINAWEEGEDVIVDSIHYDDYPAIEEGKDFREIDWSTVPGAKLKRCRINMAEGGTKTTSLAERYGEFALVNPSKEGLFAKYAWYAGVANDAGNSPTKSILKLDLVNGGRLVWNGGPREFVGEPVMVPRPGSDAEDDGWVVTLVWNGNRGAATDLLILNAHDLSEQAVLELPIAIPHGLHGSWVEHTSGDKL